MTRLLLLALLVVPIAACDSGMEDDPQPTTASVTLSDISAQARGDCDGSTPGDFQIQLTVVDAGNNTLTDLTLPTQTTYGVWPGGSGPFVSLRAGQTASFSESLSFQRPLTPSGSFSVVASGIEYDPNGARDDRMNDVSVSRSHAFSDGVFANVVGTQTVNLGSSACGLTLKYRLSVQ